jgi:prepilin-type N-terminal cleavage/methylation domain-containing protein
VLKYNRANKAFSLLELIITIAILSAGITVILEAIAFSGRTTGLSCDIVKAVFLAEDKLQELNFKEKQGLINQEPYERTGSYAKFQWKNSLVFDPDLNIYKLNFTINWQRANRVEEINVKTYLK